MAGMSILFNFFIGYGTFLFIKHLVVAFAEGIDRANGRL